MIKTINDLRRDGVVIKTINDLRRDGVVIKTSTTCEGMAL